MLLPLRRRLAGEVLTMWLGKRVWTVAIIAFCLGAAGCDNSEVDAGAPVGGVPSASRAGESGQLTYVALGDSWPNGAHCGFCRTFAGLYADGLEETTGRTIEFIDLTQQVIPGTQQGQTVDSLLSDLRSSDEVRDAVSAADIVMVSTGLNELDRVRSIGIWQGGAGAPTMPTAFGRLARDGTKRSMPS